MTGRLTVVHVADIHTRKNKDGYIGLKDFSGDVIRLYEKLGWDWQARVIITKNPQAVANRLRVQELQFQTIDRDATRLRPVQPDYLLIFQKRGKNPEPVLPRPRGELNNELWIDWAGNNWDKNTFSNNLSDISTEEDFIKYARELWKTYQGQTAVWRDINTTKVLRHKGKGGTRLNEDDTKHICPLQLEPVEQIIKMYSNPGDIVLDPFLGSGTTVYQAVMFERYGVGIELKPEYFYHLAAKNIEEAVRLSKEEDLFSMAGIEV
jgi:DNA modification methylase